MPWGRGEDGTPVGISCGKGPEAPGSGTPWRKFQEIGDVTPGRVTGKRWTKTRRLDFVLGEAGAAQKFIHLKNIGTEVRCGGTCLLSQHSGEGHDSDWWPEKASIEERLPVKTEESRKGTLGTCGKKGLQQR